MAIAFLGSAFMAKEAVGSKISLNHLIIAPRNDSKENSIEDAENDADTTDKSQDKVISSSMETTVSSMYVNRDSGQHVSSGMLVQPTFTLTHNPTEIYFSVLFYGSQEAPEVDFCFGRITHFGNVEVDTGVSYYNSLTGDGNYAAMYAGVKGPKIAGVTPSLYVEAVYSLREEAGSGVLCRLSAEKEDFLQIGDQLIGLTVDVGGNNGVYHTDPMLFSYIRGTLSTKAEIHDVVFYPAFSIQKGFGGTGGIAGDETLVYFGINYKFW